MRVGIICFQHESNTFCEVPTTYEHFAADHVLTGEAVRDFFVASKAHHEVRGMFEGLDAAGIEPDDEDVFSGGVDSEPAVTDEQLKPFRDFINQLDLDDLGHN